MRLSDTIEEFIKTLLQEDQMEVELKRNELAEYFHCAPSQINYVLATRFTPDHGYVITSQRGGGGCIRIVRVRRTSEERLSYLLNERIGDGLTYASARALCLQLQENQVVTGQEASLMASAVSPQALSAPLPESIKDHLRAKILKSMLLNILQRRGTG